MRTSGGEQREDARATEERVVAVVRELARELGGERAANAVTPIASLDRDVGLGSLERVELLVRLEETLGRELDDEFLVLETPREIARAIPRTPVRRVTHARARERQAPAAPVRLDDVTTLVEVLQRRATSEPNRMHVLLYSNGEQRKVTYAELWDGATRIARSLRDRNVRRGEPVAIMLPTGLEYLQSFMGVLAAGGVAVPLYPPARLDRMAEYLHRQARIVANAEARLMIAMDEAVPVARMLHRTAPSLETIVTAHELRDGVDQLTEFESGDQVLIQYTSGSTGDPKGVVLTHANLLTNIRAIAEGVHLGPADAVVSWLPLYHDMGLIGTWLNAMVHGTPLTLMSPLSFLARPERWLWAIHEHQATLSPAPNFAYELCVRKIRDEALEGLDLSSWRIASNGSEPVSAATLDRFARRFAPFGFKREALFPVYGLAEASVALCFPPINRGPLIDVVEREPLEREGRAVPAQDAAGALEFVSVGSPLAGHEVRLGNAHGNDVGERVVGQLFFRGPSCTSGYYRNPDATAHAISPDGWIDSGDRAYCADGELYITGREKDVIIKAGRNLMPQEIEEVVGAIDGIRKGCVACFGVPDATTGTERLVVVAETRATEDAERARLEREAIAAVADAVGVPPDVVSITDPGVVPKTPSGKIQRSAARQVYEQGRVAKPRGVPLRMRAGLALGAVSGVARSVVRKLGRVAQVVYLATVWSIVALLFGPIFLALVFLLPAGRPMRALARGASRIAMALSGCRLVVDGRERVPRDGRVVFVTNHTSYADSPVLLAAIPRDFVFVAMTEILEWPLIGTMARRGRHLTVDRRHLRQSVADAEAVADRLESGDAVLFFAEGGFSRVRGLRPFRLGAFEIAAKAGASVIPIALRGARDVLPADTHIPHPGTVRVWIGDPIRASGSDWDAIMDLRERTAEAIASHCGEPRLQAPVAPPGRGEP